VQEQPIAKKASVPFSESPSQHPIATVTFPFVGLVAYCVWTCP